jgi:CRISPR/Cas system-associated exonuclease Cas4 (RecB family)
MKESILHYIIESLSQKDMVFVFPSAVPAQFWAEKAAFVTEQPVGINRFVAWDIFKAETLSNKQKDLYPTNSAVRTMFAGNLLRENKAAHLDGAPLFSEIINPLYADNYESFVSSLAAMLPQLDLFSRRLKDKPVSRNDYFNDITLIHAKYKNFLEKNNFYESAWNRVPFHDCNKTWILFFPELADDWSEYEAELVHEAEKESARIIIVPLNAISKLDSSLYQEKYFLNAQNILQEYIDKQLIFSSYKDEIPWLVITIKKLLDCGILPEDVAVSVPALSDIFERLTLECKIRDVPISIRQGKPLSNHTGGRVFAALENCPSSRWSFAALKSLLLDKSLPWKEKNIIDELMEFGLKYRCVMGFQDRGREIDVWEKSFDRAWSPDVEKRTSIDMLKKFYLKLKKDITTIVEAKSFSEIKIHWRSFEDNYLNAEEIHDDVNKVMARIIRALDELIDVEEKLDTKNLDAIKIEKPYTIFLNYIREIEYVFQKNNEGVPIYNYRTSAGIHPLVHFIINMNQDDATAKGKNISFLREDRQGMLGLIDRDLSSGFISAYKFSGIFPVFSVSEKKATGPAIPHRMLSEHLDEKLLMKRSLLDDSYLVELNIAQGNISENDFSNKQTSPSEAQRLAYSLYQNNLLEPIQIDIRDMSFRKIELIDSLKKRLSSKNDDERISPSDMNEFIKCPFRWMLQRGLKIREKQTEVETIDQRDLGKLYHRILERFFLRIKNEGRFRAEHIPIYKKYIQEEVDNALREAKNKEGAFQESVFEMLRERISSALNYYLDEDAETLNGCIVIGPELPLRRKFDGIDVALSGISDLIVEDENQNTIITDYKTGVMPKASELLAEDDDAIPLNVQIAAYISMIEDSKQTNVKTARFYSLDNRKFQKVVSDIPPSRKNSKLPVERDTYQKEIDDVEIVFRLMIDQMNVGEYFIPPQKERLFCNECRVSSVCRILFSGGDND